MRLKGTGNLFVEKFGGITSVEKDWMSWWFRCESRDGNCRYAKEKGMKHLVDKVWQQLTVGKKIYTEREK